MVKFEKINSKFPGMYRGKVLDNVDPLKYGRLKILVHGVFDGMDTVADIENLPWAVPALPISSGAGAGYGSFSIPEIDAYVWVFFETGDVYQPVYFAEAPSGVHGNPSEAATNYPFRKIIKTKKGFTVYYDETADILKVLHPTGTIIQISADGAIVLNSKADVNVTGTGNVNISGATVNINP
jgi:hypothetical protein